MAAMTFLLSKLLWPVVQPLGLILMLVMVGGVLAWTRWWMLGRRLVLAAAVLTVVFGVLPTGSLLLATLEDRFPFPTTIGRIDGIIVLGGSINPQASAEHGQPALTDAAERLTEAVVLARAHPDAVLVFTGGSGLLLDQTAKEAPVAAALLRDLGVDPGRVILEDQSRDTYENAVMTRDLMQPQPGERWLLVTSAFHMPRAFGTFTAAGWPVVAYPVDYRNSVVAAGIGLGTPLEAARTALHEWVGLIVYRLTGRTHDLFPGPLTAPPLAPKPASVAQQAGISLR